MISIHAPRAGRDADAESTGDVQGISIHAPRAGRDSRRSDPSPCRWYFNPRAPCGARLHFDALLANVAKFQSTRPVRGATLTSKSGAGSTTISIHAPRAGRDVLTGSGEWQVPEFQSTRPVRGATRVAHVADGVRMISIHAPRAGRDEAGAMLVIHVTDFNPRAPCGARPAPAGHSAPWHPISIHAPRAGRDT